MLIRSPIIRLMTFPFGEGGSRSETDEVPIIRLMTFPFGEGGSRSETDEVPI